MSILITRNGHPYISTSINASHLRAILEWGAPEIQRGQLSNGRSSVAPSTTRSIEDVGRNIAREERSFITNGACYSNERAHLLNAVRSSKTLMKLGVVHTEFTLDEPSNLVNLDPMLHSSMDQFGLITVTLSLKSLAELTQLFNEKNRVWQNRKDRGGEYIKYTRDFSAFRRAFASATYEFIILHPKHFLPCRSVLPVYSGPNNTPTFYQVAPDGVLRQQPAKVKCPRLPPFPFKSSYRSRENDNLNPLLVAMAAQIKFRRYDRSGWPLLEEHTRLLMDQTTALVDAIYWKPIGFPQCKAKARDKNNGSQSGDDASGEETATPAPAGRKRGGQGVRTRGSQSKDIPAL